MSNSPNSNQPTTDQNLGPKLSEAQEYCLGLFNKWSKPDSELRKLDEKLWQSIDFEAIKKNFLVVADGFVFNCKDALIEIALTTKEQIKLIKINFNNLLPYQPDLLEDITELYNSGQLEIIDCLNCPELDNLVLRNELAVIKQNQLSVKSEPTWSREIIFENGSYRFKSDVAQYMAFFEDFLNTQEKTALINILSITDGLKIEINTNDFTRAEIESQYDDFIRFYQNPESIKQLVEDFENNPERYRFGLKSGLVRKIHLLEIEVKRLNSDVDTKSSQGTIYKSDRDKLKLELTQALEGRKQSSS